jgi:hypothetical protein
LPVIAVLLRGRRVIDEQAFLDKVEDLGGVGDLWVRDGVRTGFQEENAGEGNIRGETGGDGTPAVPPPMTMQSNLWAWSAIAEVGEKLEINLSKLKGL